MRFAFFPGCKSAYYVPQYEQASRAVCAALGVDLVDVEFNCCGYPVRPLHFRSFVVEAARNLALAARENLNIMTQCQCCFGSLKTAAHLLAENQKLADEVAAALAEEGLKLDGRVEVKHLLSVLDQDVGLEAIQEKVSQPFAKLNLAAHYGCHALRPSQVTGFDDPISPTIFERLIAATGAKSVDWARRLECCGNPQHGKNDQLAIDLMNRKLKDARTAGADFLAVACNYCHIQFDQVQAEVLAGGDGALPSLVFPQLLGLALGLAPAEVGLNQNRIDCRRITDFFKPPEPPPEEKTKEKAAPKEAEKTKES